MLPRHLKTALTEELKAQFVAVLTQEPKEEIAEKLIEIVQERLVEQVIPRLTKEILGAVHVEMHRVLDRVEQSIIQYLHFAQQEGEEVSIVCNYL